jgi:hypothetical protein
VPGAAQRRQANPLSALSLWKLFDNLRRSLVPAALTLLLLVAWARFPMPGSGHLRSSRSWCCRGRARL